MDSSTPRDPGDSRDPKYPRVRANMKRTASTTGVTNNSQKRPKVHHSVRSSDTVLSDNGGTAKTTSSNSRHLLRQLVQEISNDPNTAGADPQVMSAVARLDEAFRRTEKPLPTRDSLRRHSVTQSNHSESGTRTPPPILDDRLESAVFTHPAMSNSNNATYDRLEILGDAYIELIATKIIWEMFPDLPAGRISQIRETLVKNETLSGFAERFGFDRRVSVPPNYSNQSKRWTKTKGDVFEAYVAAVILSDPENGYQSAEMWLTGLWMPILKGLGHQKGELRSKEALAQKIMGKNVKLEYLEERPSIQQKGGTQTFFIAVYLTGWGWNRRLLGSGQGLSKAAAGDEAAKRVLLNNPLLLEIISAKESGGLSM